MATATIVKHFRADSNLNRAMNRGHLNRLGHPITGVYVSDDNDTSRLVRLCCGEKVNP